MARRIRVVVVGGGHNGLVAAAYLARGMDCEVLVLERRRLLGGAAVTEELVPGFRFSRASYLAGLMRPQIVAELGLARHGFEYLARDPASFTPTLPHSEHAGRSLVLSSCPAATRDSIAQFSLRDAEAFPQYEAWLGEVRELLQPFLDAPPPDLLPPRTLRGAARKARNLLAFASALYRRRGAVLPLHELLVGSAERVLGRWFESDLLKTTLATDAVIGSMASPRQQGSAYVLLHHVMGSAARPGAWAYMRGGMGCMYEIGTIGVMYV